MNESALVYVVLLHARCACGVVVRAVLPSTPCPDCRQTQWTETHGPAFGRVFQRADGWYGLEELEVAGRGDSVDVLENGAWQSTRVVEADADGFYIPQGAAGRGYYSYAGVDVVWRWAAGAHGDSAAGPFVTAESARSVCYNHSPGYLLCGVCGTEALKAEMPKHYAEWHGDSLQRVLDEVPRVLDRRD